VSAIETSELLLDEAMPNGAEPGAGQRMPAGLPRLLEGIPAHGAMSLGEHLALHGPIPAWPKRSRRAEHPLIEEVEQAGLLGRGGASFPAAAKLRAVASSRRRAVVVVNAAEGEPASLKDRTIAGALPHLMLDGATLVADALGTDEVIVAVCESARTGLEGVERAIAERAGRGAPQIRPQAVPTNYVAGQESALVNFLNGGSPIPTFTPPMVFQQGVARRPTFVGNAETLSQLALIARYGPDWFRELGTPSQPGSALVTLSGPVANPGVYEIEYGATLTSLIDAAGGATARLRAALLGGYGGSWVGGEHLYGLALSDEHLAPFGASLGAGVVLLLSEEACPVAETARILRWLADQSSRQCGPCVHGLAAIAQCLEALISGGAQPNADLRLARLADLVRGRGACRHPDGAARLLQSAIEAFGPEFSDHLGHGPCAGCQTPSELPLPATTVPGGPARKPLRRPSISHEQARRR
jgi:NADH:ubiquinone oxidoreductase subunit F (NADH-binding)